MTGSAPANTDAHRGDRARIAHDIHFESPDQPPAAAKVLVNWVEAMGIEPPNLLHAMHFRPYRFVTTSPSLCE